MYHVAHLIHRINLLGTAFKKKKKAAFQTSKTTIYGPYTSELKSVSKYQLSTFHLKNFQKYMFFYTLP